MLATVIRDIYREGEKRDVQAALDELCSPEDSWMWASAGIYCYWSPADRSILYVGLARDLWERFGHHNGLLPCPVDGCERDQIDEWFSSHDSIGLSIVVQSSMVQPLTRRSVAALVNDPGWDKEDLSEEYADHQSEVIRELACAEGAIIETHLRQHGAIPLWNRIGGSREGREVVAGQGDNILEILTGQAEHLIVARAPLRDLANDPTAAVFEDFIHAARMQAIMFAGMGGRGASSDDVIGRISAMQDNPLGDRARLLEEQWLDRQSPFLTCRCAPERRMGEPVIAVDVDEYGGSVLLPTIERLRSAAREADDATGFFAAMYARVTDRVQTAITDGRFGDGERMARFTRMFADWYLGPRDGSRARPACWKAADDVSGDRGLLIVQHLLLGINAHVNHDLPQVVVELADGEASLEVLRSDFDAINDILAETQPDILRDLGRVSGWTQLAVSRGGGRVFNFSLGRARAQAWQSAERIHRLDDTARASEVAELDRLVSVLAHLITRPSGPVSWLLAIPRWLEHDDPRVVTSRLLGHLA